MALNRGLFEDFNVTWTDRRGRSLLHHAVLRCDYRLVQDMLIAGTSVFCKDRVGATPLHLAVLLEDGDRIVDLLLSEGADFNEPKADGLTPLHEACWCGNEYAVRLFLSREAKIELIDGNGRTAREVAVEYDWPDLAAMIEAEDRRRKAVEMRDVCVKMTSEWGMVLGAKLKDKKGLEGLTGGGGGIGSSPSSPAKGPPAGPGFAGGASSPVRGGGGVGGGSGAVGAAAGGGAGGPSSPMRAGAGARPGLA